MSKNRIAALGAGATSAALVGSALFAPAAMAQEDQGPFPSPSAFAVQATGLVDITRTPYVVDEGDESKIDVQLPQDNPFLTAETLNAEAGPGYAKSSILHVNLGGDRAPELGSLNIESISATCEDGEGSIALLKIDPETGEEINIGEQIEPNTGDEFPDNPLLNVTFNKQVRHDDGSLTVTAVSIELLSNEIAEELGVNQTINLASATCSDVPDDGGETTPPTTPPDDGDDNGDKDNGGDNGHSDDGDNDEAEEDGTAPTPVPSPGHISVTG